MTSLRRHHPRERARSDLDKVSGEEACSGLPVSAQRWNSGETNMRPSPHFFERFNGKTMAENRVAAQSTVVRSVVGGPCHDSW